MSGVDEVSDGMDAVVSGFQEYVINELGAGKRLDQALTMVTPDVLSRSRLQALVKQGHVTLNGAVINDSSKRLVLGDVLSVRIPEPEDPIPKPQDIPLDVVYEDAQLLVINKPTGLVVHPGAGNPDGTLVNALLYHCGDTLSGIGGVKRPGIVHRLDKDTSGLIMVAKTDKAHQFLSAQLSDRSLTRIYSALVWGVPHLNKGIINKPIGRHPTNRLKMSIRTKSGKEAITAYRVIQSYSNCVSLVECKLKTGRTHQIRVHMEVEGLPMIGDTVYGGDINKIKSLARKSDMNPDVFDTLQAFPRQALHARHIQFIHPDTEEVMQFTAEPPKDMQDIVGLLK